MITCAACGFEAQEGSRFCPSCGNSLAEAAGPAEMLKLVTILFADVVGSTARAEVLHPEDVRALMADFFAAMSEEIRGEGGTIEKFVGDAIMAVFGVPAAHEDDPVRAVRAARRMLARLAVWNDGREPAEQLELRVGLNTGDVVTSDAGAPGGELLVTGDAVNVAARLQQAAEPGTIVIGERTARAARSHFELRALREPLALKGKSQPVAAWVVEGEREEAEPRGVPGLAAPLVGRDDELASLRAAFDRVARQHRPELMTLTGDAGIGKSRLVREFLAPLDADARVLVGRCLPYGQGVTLWPLAEMLKAEAGVLDSDPTDTAAAKISRLVETSVAADLAGDAARTAAALASTLGLRPPGNPLESLDPRELYRELTSAWRALLGSLARRSPVVAVVEDLHWADPTMLDVLDELAERGDGPILFLCTARPDLLRSRPEWGGGRRGFSALPLDPLTAEESDRLVSHLLDLDALPESLRSRMLARAEGNPFFVEEIVRQLVDEGILGRDGGTIDDVEIPDSVQAVILARLDLLSPEERRVAQRAAVVGRAFWDGAVASIAGVADVDTALTTLRRREFVLERLSSSIAGQREFVFKHVLIRDVAYESLPRRERARAHADAAAWIEQASGERAGELSELLAHHYDSAYSYVGDEDWRARARSQLLAAAANAHRRFAIGQGERFANRAVELSQGAAERAEALEALGDLHNTAYFGDAAWRAYSDALAELPDRGPAFARVAAKASLFGARWVGTVHELPELEEVRRTIDNGLAAALPGSADRALLLVMRGFLVVQRERPGDEEADAAVREALAAAEEVGDPDVLSAALDLVQAQLMARGRYGDFYRSALRRRELTAGMSDAKEIGDSYAMVAASSQHIGRYAEAEQHASACVDRARGVDSGSYLHGLAWRVAARFELGKWDEALVDAAELERVASLDPRELPAGYTARGYTYAGLCHELRGEHEAADRYAELMLRYFELKGEPGRGRLSAPPLAVLLGRRGRFDEALSVIPLYPRTASAGFTLAALCELAALRGSWDEAERLVAAAREEAEWGELLALPPHADRLEGRAAAAAGDVSAAVESLRRSADGFASVAARWDEARSRLLLADAVAGVDPARAERELAAALAVFERLGAVRELEQARSLAAASRS
jgi:class 3 adenylate cyclase